MIPAMLQVTSEIGRLRTVLVHEPGPEVDRMVPAMMEELLFDDILFGGRAREEHCRFRRLLQLLGIEVLDVRELLVQTLAEPAARDWLWQVLRPELPPDLRSRPEASSPDELVEQLVVGVALDGAPAGVDVADLYRLSPVPNWCFQRDPQVVLGTGVVLAAMATPARWREGLFARAVFRFHPRLRDAEVLCDPLEPAEERSRLLHGFHRPRLEGGDVLVLSPEVVAIGLSERTNAVAVEILARALARRDDGPRWLELVHLPHRRAYMHLDTVFTPADHELALVHAPVILGAGGETAETYEIDLHSDDLTPRHRGLLLAALAPRGIRYEAIACGGDDPIQQHREQWTDGANTLALAPGVITLYDRNVATAAALDRRGFAVVEAEDVLLGRAEVELEAGRPTCLLLASHEISRARGGPHCLSHPLFRDRLG